VNFHYFTFLFLFDLRKHIIILTFESGSFRREVHLSVSYISNGMAVRKVIRDGRVFCNSTRFVQYFGVF
jgi:hypothetical protein